jgi:hypothetical protein
MTKDGRISAGIAGLNVVDVAHALLTFVVVVAYDVVVVVAIGAAADDVDDVRISYANNVHYTVRFCSVRVVRVFDQLAGLDAAYVSKSTTLRCKSYLFATIKY